MPRDTWAASTDHEPEAALDPSVKGGAGSLKQLPRAPGPTGHPSVGVLRRRKAAIATAPDTKTKRAKRRRCVRTGKSIVTPFPWDRVWPQLLCKHTPAAQSKSSEPENKLFPPSLPFLRLCPSLPHSQHTTLRPCSAAALGKLLPPQEHPSTRAGRTRKDQALRGDTGNPVLTLTLTELFTLISSLHQNRPY